MEIITSFFGARAPQAALIIHTFIAAVTPKYYVFSALHTKVRIHTANRDFMVSIQ